MTCLHLNYSYHVHTESNSTGEDDGDDTEEEVKRSPKDNPRYIPGSVKKNSSSKQVVMMMAEAVRKGDTEAMESCLLQGVSIATANENGQTLLEIALFNGHDGIAMRLIELGADPDVYVQTKRGDVPILHPEFLSITFSKTANRDKGRALALFAAAITPNPILHTLLLSKEYRRLANTQHIFREIHEDNSNLFALLAVKLLEDLSAIDAFKVVAAVDDRYGNVSPMDIAIESNNTKFIANHVVQRFLAFLWRGKAN